MSRAKSTKKQTAPLKDRAIQAALDLSAEKGWDNVTMADIAKRCSAHLQDLRDLFDDRQDIVVAYGRRIDRVVMERFESDVDSDEHDRLFDIMMARFDVLNDDRAAVISILRSYCVDPKQAVIGFPHLGRSMIWMMEAAGIDANGPCGAAKALGLVCIYMITLKTWMDDDSADMGRTMAVLDKALRNAARAGAALRII